MCFPNCLAVSQLSLHLEYLENATWLNKQEREMTQMVSMDWGPQVQWCQNYRHFQQFSALLCGSSLRMPLSQIDIAPVDKANPIQKQFAESREKELAQTPDCVPIKHLWDELKSGLQVRAKCLTSLPDLSKCSCGCMLHLKLLKRGSN